MRNNNCSSPGRKEIPVHLPVRRQVGAANTTLGKSIGKEEGGVSASGGRVSFGGLQMSWTWVEVVVACH